MTRSFGDSVAAEVGVSTDPEIIEVSLTKNEKIIVIASDGIWEFLTNEAVCLCFLIYRWLLLCSHFLKNEMLKELLKP
jgi:serine/threonine protein phosphatase PrpC